MAMTPALERLDQRRETEDRVPKILGADVELGNFILGMEAPGGSGRLASRWLLREVDGLKSWAPSSQGDRDWGRTFLSTNGGCVYIDSDHLEIALPETWSAFDHAAYWRAMLDVARHAMHRVNRKLPHGCRVHVLANCSDGQHNSYGSHVNVTLTRRAWDDIILRKPHYLAYLAAFQITSLVYTGQGKVGSERQRPPADFQLSQRADFIETLIGLDTMVTRAIVNTRDEPLCGSARSSSTGDRRLARLHVIFFDSTMCQHATVLRVGTLQMVVAMLEAGDVDTSLALDDPLQALDDISRDPSLAVSVRTTTGAAKTAIELQFGFLENAKRFASQGGFADTVPDAERVLALWEDTLVKLQERDFVTLSRRLDWVLKHRLLQSVLARRPELTWQSSEIRHLDQVFASLDEDEGLFWMLERSGHVDRLVSNDAVLRASHEPPDNTRAWTRAQLLRRLGPAHVDHVDWDVIRCRSGSTPKAVHLPLPFGATRAIHGRHFTEDTPLDAVLTALDAVDDWPAPSVEPLKSTYWAMPHGGH